MHRQVATDPSANVKTIRVNSDDTVEISGNNDTTNMLKVAADGEVSLHGTARVKQAIEIANANLGKGATAPTEVIVGNFDVWEFGIGDDSVFTVHVPHDWCPGTDIVVNIDWQVNEAYAVNSAEVRWRIVYASIPHDGAEAIDAAGTTVNSADINVPATARGLIETALTIASADIAAGDQMGITLSRIALVGGNNPAVEPGITDLHIEYVVDRLGEAT
jgi:hypothetical protein